MKPLLGTRKTNEFKTETMKTGEQETTIKTYNTDGDASAVDQL
jgi:hypothetical protein